MDVMMDCKQDNDHDNYHADQRLVEGAFALVYAAALPMLQQVARRHGYALAVHGSMQTDLDLIAVPWMLWADDADTLIAALIECIDGFCPVRDEGQPEVKAHGRRAWSIHVKDGWPYLDVSVMPRMQDVEKIQSVEEIQSGEVGS